MVLLSLVGIHSARGQDSSAVSDTTEARHEAAWNEIITREGLEIAYVFYTEADAKNNGVVVRLRNHNDYPVRYHFTIIFRGRCKEAHDRVQGRLAPRTIKTGEKEGLFWVPFEGQPIAEVGLRGVDVTRVQLGATSAASF